jgi:hypothetical protein
MAADDRARRATQRAQQQLAQVLKGLRSPKRQTIPWLPADPPFNAGIHLWMLWDGRLRGYRPDATIMEYPTGTPGASSGGSFPSDPQPALFQTTYAAAWAKTFCDTHGAETGTTNGYGDAANGGHVNRQLMIGLPDSTIRTDLAGAVIRAVELRFLNVDAYGGTVTLHVGVHMQTSSPSDYSEVVLDAAQLEYPKVGYGEEWRPVSPAFGRWLRDDTARGLSIHQPAGAPNGGAIDWAQTQIRVSFVK